MEQSHEDALIDEIIGDAKKKAGRTLRRSKREAGQIVEKAEKEAESIRRAADESAHLRAEKEKAVVLATVGLDARRVEMAAKESLITEAFDSARKQMLDKKAYDHPAMLARLVAAAAEAIGGDSFTVALPEEDQSADLGAIRDRVCDLFGRTVELRSAEEPAAIKGGAIVYDSEGRRMVDNSFEGRLARMQDELRRRAAQILFGETES